MRDLTLKAIKKWAVPINRVHRIRFSDNCDPEADHKIWVYLRDGANADIAESECSKYDYNFARTEKRQIFLCFPRSVGWEAVLTHEAGHLWGLCDQYVPREGHRTNCDPNNQTEEPVAESVMARLSYGELQEDDKLGIIAAALRDDVPANLKWKREVKLDTPLLAEVQQDRCSKCGGQLSQQRYCGIYSKTYKRWIVGDYVSCDGEDEAKNRCTDCGVQNEGKRYCGIFTDRWLSGSWVTCRD